MPNPTTAAEMQLRYLSEAVETATPAVRLGMLWDRLELLLQRADGAFEAADLFAINDNLLQAQDILLGLADTMRTDTWETAGRLAALYRFLHSELVMANVDKDRSRLRSVADMVARLADAWRTAITATTTEPVHGVA
jgi:flagellar protein FliS